MKNYKVTVNGVVYDVAVEEVQEQPVSAGTQQPKAPAAAAPVSAAVKASLAGAIGIKASVPGKVFKIEASVGQTVKTGDPIIILESMKMEIPVVAPQDGTIASIDVAAGDTVESGDALASMN